MWNWFRLPVSLTLLPAWTENNIASPMRVREFQHSDRIVVGTTDARKVMGEI